MHELALMESLVDAVDEKLAALGERAVVVTLAVGDDAGVAVDALRFCFDVCAAGTRVEGAQLRIHEGEGAQLALVELEVL